MESVECNNIKGLSKKTIVIISIILAAVVLAALAVTWYILTVNNISQAMTVEAGTTVSASDFKIRNMGGEAEFVTDMSAIDMSIPGEHTVTIRYRDDEYQTLMQVVDSVAPVLTTQDLCLFTTQKPRPEDFVVLAQDSTKVFYAYDAEPDMSIPGKQEVRVLAIDLGGNITVATANLTVVEDNTVPNIKGVSDMQVYLGNDIDYLANVMVWDNLDANPVIEVDDSEVDLTVPGTYTVRYIASDASFNETLQRAKITVVDDTQGPQILGVNKLSLYQGRTISYRNGIIVEDDYAAAPMLSIDSSQVDLSQPGTYNVTYTATDDVGNETTVTTTVTVKKQPSSYVEDSVVYAKADEILAKIITEDMTTKEKVQAIAKWFRKNCSYVSYSDKSDRMQAAYKMMTRKYGDCFNYFAACSVMLERLDIPQINVERSRNSVRRTRHYWSMVSLDGGETYYHLDVSPHFTFGHISTCLVTDATLSRCNRYIPGYYTMDKGKYPATPETAPE